MKLVKSRLISGKLKTACVAGFASGVADELHSEVRDNETKRRSRRGMGKHRAAEDPMPKETRTLTPEETTQSRSASSRYMARHSREMGEAAG